MNNLKYDALLLVFNPINRLNKEDDSNSRAIEIPKSVIQTIFNANPIIEKTTH